MPGVDMLATAFNGANAAYLADLYARWVQNPGSVDASFAALFGALNDEARSVLTDASGASWAPRHFEVGEPEPAKAPAKGAKAAPGLSDKQLRSATLDSIRALMMIRVYRVRGHLEAQLDPLGLTVPKPHPELDPAAYGFTEADMDRPIFIDNVLGRETATPREILAVLRSTYCGPIGVEYMHIQDPEQKTWLQRRIEGAPWTTAIDADTKKTILRQLTEAEGFEAFCQKRYVGTKRFGLEGGESHHAGATRHHRGRGRRPGWGKSAIGMPHRGRLNTLGQHRAQAVHGGVQRVRRRELRSRTTCRARAM